MYHLYHLFYIVRIPPSSIFTLEITLPFAKLCYAFEEIPFFSAAIILGKKGHSKLSKNEPENIPRNLKD